MGQFTHRSVLVASSGHFVLLLKTMKRLISRGRAVNHLALMRWAMALFYFMAGIAHLIFPKPFLTITPAWVPFGPQVILVTGLCELAGAVALLVPRTRKAAGTMLALYAACVFPANIKHLLDSIGPDGWPHPFWYHGPRMLLQPILVWWALYSSEVTNWVPVGRTKRSG